MQIPAPLHLLSRLVLACCLASLLPGCGPLKIERTDANGNSLHKPADKPVVGTHVSPPAPR